MSVPGGVSYIDVTLDSEMLQQSVPVYDGNRNPQSLAWSALTGHLYMMQVQEGTGNLTLNRYTAAGGSITDWALHGHMTLSGFGHGVAFGVWDKGDGEDWFFTECDADSNMRGTGVTAFRYDGGGSYINHATVHHNVGYDVSCSVEQNGNYIAIRQNVAPFGHIYNCYGVSDFYNHGLAATELLNGFPEDPQDTGNRTFEGWTVAGKYLYTMCEGKSGSENRMAFIRSYDLNTVNPGSGYFKAVGTQNPSGANPGEFQGMTTLNVGLGSILLYAVTVGGDYPNRKFDLHSRP